MGTKTGISWTDATWNPIRGCSRISEGCRHCYAERVAYRFSGPGQPYEGTVQIGADGERRAQWNGKVRFVEEHLLDPLRSMSDLFHENVTDEMRDKIFAVMALCPQHTFQVLTKRPERMLAYLTNRNIGGRILAELVEMAQQNIGGDWTEAWPLPNVWLGCSVEDQKTADERIPLLLQTPAAVRFVSAEPLLGPIQLLWDDGWGGVDEPPLPDGEPTSAEIYGENGSHFIRHGASRLDWVIVGGESGQGARPMHPDWARSLRDQCKAAGVPFFFKQWGEWGDWDGRNDDDAAADAVAAIVNSDGDISGKIHNFGTPEMTEWAYRIGKKAAGHLLDGVEHHAFPEARS